MQFQLRTLSARLAVTNALAALAVGGAPHCEAVEHVRHVVEDRIVAHSGEVVIEDAAGSLMLRTADDQLHVIPATHVRERTHDDEAFAYLDDEQLGEALLAEMPPGFRLRRSTHYVMCYNTTDAYARWCSTLLERLQRAFLATMSRYGCEATAPPRRLPVLIFADQASYAEHARSELGANAANVIGYYSMATNRIVMYDLTGSQAAAREINNRGSMRDVSALLSRPAAEPLVATVVHEATHQIAFNCGVQTRFNDNPLWMSEGLAMYFETPDLSSSRSWSGVGEVNFARWDLFQANQRAGRLLSIERLIGSDQAFRNPATGTDAYAQSWALSYFLLRWRQEQYIKYLAAVAAKPVLRQAKPAERLAEFKEHFGDLDHLQLEFQRRMRRIR